MIKKAILIGLLLVKPAFGGVVVDKALIIEPQLKIGKMENGNRFAELQYAKFEMFFKEGLSLEGSFSTGFTGARGGESTAFNHAINRVGLKATYRPNKDIGFFVEGSWTDNIPGANNAASYFVYDTYQAVGVSFRIAEYR